MASIEASTTEWDSPVNPKPPIASSITSRENMIAMYYHQVLPFAAANHDRQLRWRKHITNDSHLEQQVCIQYPWTSTREGQARCSHHLPGGELQLRSSALSYCSTSSLPRHNAPPKFGLSRTSHLKFGLSRTPTLTSTTISQTRTPIPRRPLVSVTITIPLFLPEHCYHPQRLLLANRTETTPSLNHRSRSPRFTK